MLLRYPSPYIKVKYRTFSQCRPQVAGVLPDIASTTAVAANMGFLCHCTILNKILSMSACASGQCVVEIFPV